MTALTVCSHQLGAKNQSSFGLANQLLSLPLSPTETVMSVASTDKKKDYFELLS